jgi:hypothetical protein
VVMRPEVRIERLLALGPGVRVVRNAA